MKKLNYIILSIVLILIDQVIKYLIVFFNNQYPNFNIVLIPHLLNINFVANRGISFGLFQNFPLLIIIINLLICGYLFYLIYKMTNKILLLGCSLVFSGALANIIDRLFYHYVVDYIDINIFVCNLADILIFIGILLILFYITKGGNDGKN